MKYIKLNWLILFFLSSISIYAQDGIVFEEGKKATNKAKPGENSRKITILSGIAYQKLNYDDVYLPVISSKIEFRSPFWHKEPNFSSKRLGAGINFDYLFRGNGQYLVTFPVTYTYGETFSLFFGAGFLNKNRRKIDGDLISESRISILAIRFGLSYDIRYKSLTLRPVFNQDYLGDDTSYQFSLLLGYTF